MTLATLMRSAPSVIGSPAWGTNADGSISMDSFSGNACDVTALTGTVYYGYDAEVADTDSASTYKGVPASANTPFDVVAWCRGIVDADAIWIYSATTQDMQIVFAGF